MIKFPKEWLSLLLRIGMPKRDALDFERKINRGNPCVRNAKTFGGMYGGRSK